MPDTASLGKRELNRLNNRKAILDAAQACFQENGYEQTTIRDIIRRTDLAAGTFYNYFPDKRAIFVALFEDFLAALRARIKSGQSKATSESELVRHTCDALFISAARAPLTYELAYRNDQAIRELFGSDIIGLATATLERTLQRSGTQRPASNATADYRLAACRGMAHEVSLEVARRAKESPQDAENEARLATEFVAGLLYEAENLQPGTQQKRA